MWDVFQEALDRKSGRSKNGEEDDETQFDRSLSFVIGGGDQMYSDGEGGPHIWNLLQKEMYKKGNKLYPNLDEMKSWYRDNYRGYWGFDALQHIYSNYPNYMIWDDHELHDGWGSHDLDDDDVIRKQFLDFKKKGLTAKNARDLIARMIEAGKFVYNEYQHAHNPDPVPKQNPDIPLKKKIWDYHFEAGPCAVYVMDGRGRRNMKNKYKILGSKQMKRFKDWLNSDKVKQKEFVFVTSAVPVFHLASLMGTKKFKKFLKIARQDGLIDDLVDHWEDEEHKYERKELMEALFKAANDGRRICILSGDVHLAAAFKLSDDDGNIIYQLTSSAITWNLSRLKGIALKLGVPEKGESKVKEGNKVLFKYNFERLALYKQSNFAIVKTDPESGQATFQLYGDPESRESINEVDSDYERKLEAAGMDLVRSHSMARIPLVFRNFDCEKLPDG
jgi:alkaline phosphatase D